MLDADRLANNRLTRWRWTRALNQLASNLGIACIGDDRLLHPLPVPERISLAGTWKAALTGPLPLVGANDPRPKDPGMSDRARGLIAKDADEKVMQDVPVSVNWQSYGGDWGVNGEAVFRRTVDIPASMAGRDLTLSLGVVDDMDDTFFDGEAVGSTTSATPSFWSVLRRYNVPAKLATAGRHVIAVRVFDHGGGGGMYGTPDQLSLTPKDAALAAPPASLYHADYRTDFLLGDDPYRYQRW